jgi:hypothetical protein
VSALEVVKMLEFPATLVADIVPVSAMSLNMDVPLTKLVILLATTFALEMMLNGMDVGHVLFELLINIKTFFTIWTPELLSHDRVGIARVLL